jgi:cell cycle arrest protein BUB3
VKAEGKIYSLSLAGSRIVVATSTKKLLVYDIRFLSTPEQMRESPLKHQLRKVACSLDGNSVAVSSVDGRVAIEYLDMDPEQQARKYQFKCHRVMDVAYPVNAIVYHPIYGNVL